MSIKYYCDYCKEEITKSMERIVLQAMTVGEDKKSMYHLHGKCWRAGIKAYFDTEAPMIGVSGSIVPKETNAITVEDSAKEDEEAKDDEVEEVKKVKVAPSALFQPWEVSICTGNRTKYFNDEVCSQMHRFLLLGAKAKPLAARFHIPYQSVVQYIHSYDKQNLDTYVPVASKSILDTYSAMYKYTIPKLRALLATCTWSLEEAASECHIPDSVVKTIWDELPYFLNTDSKDSESVIDY